ncbi:unnamed protein product, partial [Choristocarpus tenellus]
MGNGNAMGPNNPPVKLLKLDLQEDVAILLGFRKIVLDAWNQQVVRQDRKNTVIIVLYNKKGCCNYRGIIIGVTSSNVLNKVVRWWLRHYLE